VKSIPIEKIEKFENAPNVFEDIRKLALKDREIMEKVGFRYSFIFFDDFDLTTTKKKLFVICLFLRVKLHSFLIFELIKNINVIISFD
jgi:hypothetical protein